MHTYIHTFIHTYICWNLSVFLYEAEIRHNLFCTCLFHNTTMYTLQGMELD